MQWRRSRSCTLRRTRSLLQAKRTPRRVRAEALRLGADEVDEPDNKEKLATTTQYQAFAWAVSAVDALQKDDQLPDETIAELAGWLSFTSLEREEKVQYALFFLSTKLQMLAATDNDLKPKVIELVQAFKTDFAAQARVVAAAERITISTDATTAEDVVSEVTNFLQHESESCEGLILLEAALQKRLDMYNCVILEEQEDVEEY